MSRPPKRAGVKMRGNEQATDQYKFQNSQSLKSLVKTLEQQSKAGKSMIGKERGRLLPVLIKCALVVGLGFLSWLATYSGMMELIEASGGAIAFEHKLGIGFSVAMLMLMVIYLLDALFSPLRWWLRLAYLAGYLFLTLISVGFGFGFYWKYLSSHSEATRAAESAVGQVQGALQIGVMRLEQLRMTLENLTSLSSQKAEQERTVGQTCPKSPPGDGPRRLLRDTDAKNFRFASDFVSKRTDLLKKEITDLNGQFAHINSKAPAVVDPANGTRTAFLQNLNSQLALTITRFNVFRTDPQLTQLRESFATRASQTVFDDSSGGTISCPDPQLHMALMGVVKAIDGLPELQSPRFNNVEGSDAILEAFRRLTISLIGYLTLDPAPTPEELREAQKNALSLVNSTANQQNLAILSRQPGLGERDYIPLFIALFVDLCLLLVSVNRPVNRLQSFWGKVQNAENTGMHEVLRRFHEVHFGGKSERLDVFHDVMFDIGHEHYVAVPLDLRVRPKGKNLTDQDLRTHQDKLIRSRYLSTLMVTLEEAGLASRTPRIGPFKARRKLKALKSPFSDAPSFRVYKFGKGAWPALVMEDVFGQSRNMDDSNARQVLQQLQLLMDQKEVAAIPQQESEPLRLAHIPQISDEQSLNKGFLDKEVATLALPKPEASHEANQETYKETDQQPLQNLNEGKQDDERLAQGQPEHEVPQSGNINNAEPKSENPLYEAGEAAKVVSEGAPDMANVSQKIQGDALSPSQEAYSEANRSLRVEVIEDVSASPFQQENLPETLQETQPESLNKSLQRPSVVIRPVVQEWSTRQPVAAEMTVSEIRPETAQLIAGQELESKSTENSAEGSVETGAESGPENVALKISEALIQMQNESVEPKEHVPSESQDTFLGESHHLIRAKEECASDFDLAHNKNIPVQFHQTHENDEEFINKIHNEIISLNSHVELFGADLNKDQEIFENIYQEKIVNSSFSEGQTENIDIDIEKIAWHFAHKNAANGSNR